MNDDLHGKIERHGRTQRHSETSCFQNIDVQFLSARHIIVKQMTLKMWRKTTHLGFHYQRQYMTVKYTRRVIAYIVRSESVLITELELLRMK